VSSSIVESLYGLRDVQGVLGSFVLGRSGKVVCKDLPRVFDDRVFEEVGPRILRLKETLSGEGPGLDNVVIRYSEHKLHLRFLSASVLGVITSTGVNPASLKMALTLSSRRIESDLPFEPGLSSGDRRSAFPAATPPLWTDESSPDAAAQAAQEPLPGPPTLRSPKPGHASHPPPPEPPPAPPPEAPRRAPILYRGRRIG
jgi:hypothetical protein